MEVIPTGSIALNVALGVGGYPRGRDVYKRQGNTKDNLFYLKMGGFFNESVPMGTKFYCKPTGKEPEIDWGSLEAIVTISFHY